MHTWLLDNIKQYIYIYICMHIDIHRNNNSSCWNDLSLKPDLQMSQTQSLRFLGFHISPESRENVVQKWFKKTVYSVCVAFLNMRHFHLGNHRTSQSSNVSIFVWMISLRLTSSSGVWATNQIAGMFIPRFYCLVQSQLLVLQLSTIPQKKARGGGFTVVYRRCKHS